MIRYVGYYWNTSRNHFDHYHRSTSALEEETEEGVMGFFSVASGRGWIKYCSWFGFECSQSVRLDCSHIQTGKRFNNVVIEIKNP